MESPEKLLRQLRSLDSLKSVVKTMKTLSAANIRQYELAVQSIQEYYRTVEMGLQVILRQSGEVDLPPPPRTRACAAVVFGSDHGLCGRFNESVVNYMLDGGGGDGGPAPSLERDSFVVVGARAADYLEGLGGNRIHIEDVLLSPGSTAGITRTVQQILLWIDRWHSDLQVNDIGLFYNRLLDDGRYRPQKSALLPVDMENFQGYGRAPWPSGKLPAYTMNWHRLFGALLQQYFFVRIFRACAESQEAEHAVRLRAMQEAERNIDKTHEQLVAAYRRVRQEAITTELLDVLSGFNATGESIHGG